MIDDCKNFHVFLVNKKCMYLDYNLSSFFVYKLEKRNTNIYFENFAEFVTEATSERESGY